MQDLAAAVIFLAGISAALMFSITGFRSHRKLQRYQRSQELADAVTKELSITYEVPLASFDAVDPERGLASLALGALPFYSRLGLFQVDGRWRFFLEPLDETPGRWIELSSEEFWWLMCNVEDHCRGALRQFLLRHP
jgi:hypothetical protein